MWQHNVFQALLQAMLNSGRSEVSAGNTEGKHTVSVSAWPVKVLERWALPSQPELFLFCPDMSENLALFAGVVPRQFLSVLIWKNKPTCKHTCYLNERNYIVTAA